MDPHLSPGSEAQGPQVTDRWIATYQLDGETVASVFYANTDSSATEVWESQHRGALAVWRTRAWARRAGYGRLQVRRADQGGRP